MRFALRTANLEDILKTPSNEKEHACGVLSKHNVIKDKVNAIRKRFNDWQKDLLPMLDSFHKTCKKKKILNGVGEGKKEKPTADKTPEKLLTEKQEGTENIFAKKNKLKLKKKKGKGTENKNVISDLNNSESKIGKKNKNTENKNMINDLKNCESKTSNKKLASDFSNGSKKLDINNTSGKFQNKSHNAFDADNNVTKKLKINSNKLENKINIAEKAEKPLKKGNTPKNKLQEKSHDDDFEVLRKEEKDINNRISDSDTENKLEKVIDPFFVNKKILKPNVANDDNDKSSESGVGDKEIFESNKFRKTPKNSLWNVKKDTQPDKSFRQKSQKEGRSGNIHNKRTLPQEELHPSWAAKKSVKPIIQPFQGKKIKFNDD